MCFEIVSWCLIQNQDGRWPKFQKWREHRSGWQWQSGPSVAMGTICSNAGVRLYTVTLKITGNLIYFLLHNPIQQNLEQWLVSSLIHNPSYKLRMVESLFFLVSNRWKKLFQGVGTLFCSTGFIFCRLLRSSKPLLLDWSGVSKKRKGSCKWKAISFFRLTFWGLHRNDYIFTDNNS